MPRGPRAARKELGTGPVTRSALLTSYYPLRSQAGSVFQSPAIPAVPASPELLPSKPSECNQELSPVVSRDPPNKAERVPALSGSPSVDARDTRDTRDLQSLTVNVGISEGDPQVFTQTVNHQALESQTGELAGEFTEGPIGVPIQEAKGKHTPVNKPDTRAKKGVNSTNNTTSTSIIINMQTGQTADGLSGQVNQHIHQLTHQHIRQYAPTPSKEISGIIGTTGTTGSAIPVLPSLSADSDTNSFFSTLSTKADMDRMTATLQQVLREEFKEVKESLHSLTFRVDTIEQNQTAAEQKIATLEAKLAAQSQYLHNVRLQQDNLENRSRRNNLKIRGIPETTSAKELRPTVTVILNKILGRDSTADIELDRVHRIQGNAPLSDGRPRDTLCRVHFYIIKEEIIRKAWSLGTIDFNGATIQILPDLSKYTLQMRRSMKPLLDKLREEGATYRWGFPFSLHIQKGQQFFVLRAHTQLPDMFARLSMTPILLHDWTDTETGLI